ncbi:MAG: metalloregulator ArsR/SmtB family transcription factor [Gammaproteobacteria bacterium]
MVKSQTPLDTVFHALADPTRRAILHRLAQGETSVTDLAAPYTMSLPAVSKHLRALERSGLIKRRIAGRRHYFQLRPARLAAAHEWLSFYRRFWGERLDALEYLLHDTEQEND